jgi:diguanylate cyclase (GGDEF)-like protein
VSPYHSGSSARANQLLILNSSAQDVERIATFLRQGGLSLQAEATADAATLKVLLSTHAWDLVLCCAYDRAIDLATVLSQYQETDRGVPLLVLADQERSRELRVQAMGEGARDLIEQEDLAHLHLAIKRELFDLGQRRRLALVQRQNESERRPSRPHREGTRQATAFIRNGNHVHASRAYLELFGYSGLTKIGGLPLKQLVAEEHHEELHNCLNDLQSPDASHQARLEIVCRRRDDTRFDAVFEFSTTRLDGTACRRLCVRPRSDGVAQPRTPWHDSQGLDPDTGLVTRAVFLELLKARLLNPGVEPDSLALFYIELDGFAQTQGTIGLSASCALLRESGALLAQRCPEDAVLARFGDAAFTLLVPDVHPGETEQLTATIPQALSGHEFSVAGESVRLTCSVGISLSVLAGDCADTLLDYALRACRLASAAGGNQSQSYPPVSAAQESNLSEQERRFLLPLLDAALNGQGLKLAYQPIVSLDSDTREQYEVVVRIADDTGRQLDLETCADRPELGDRLRALNRLIVQRAIQQLSMQRQKGLKIGFFVPLAQAGLEDESLLKWIHECLHESSVRGQWVTFQIGEAHARKHLKEAARLMIGLKKANCGIALEQFGLLPKPEVLLQHLPVDYVKYAPAFVEGLVKNKDKQQQLVSLNELILDQDVKGIATAVEEAPVLTVLWTAGIGYVQGNFLQEPSEKVDFTPDA